MASKTLKNILFMIVLLVGYEYCFKSTGFELLIFYMINLVKTFLKQNINFFFNNIEIVVLNLIR